MEEADHYRCRRIYLKQSDDPARQSEAACAALANIDGMLLAAAHSENCVHIIYSLDELTYDIVVELLAELNFEIDNSFLLSMRNTIYEYLEDNAREHLHIDASEQPQETSDSPEIPHQDNDRYWEDYR